MTKKKGLGSSSEMTKGEMAVLMIAQGIVANPVLQAQFWERYEENAKILGAKEAAEEVEKAIAYRAGRIAYFCRLQP